MRNVLTIVHFFVKLVNTQLKRDGIFYCIFLTLYIWWITFVQMTTLQHGMKGRYHKNIGSEFLSPSLKAETMNFHHSSQVSFYSFPKFVSFWLLFLYFIKNGWIVVDRYKYTQLTLLLKKLPKRINARFLFIKARWKANMQSHLTLNCLRRWLPSKN